MDDSRRQHQYDGRIALVTAAAGVGIGQAIARRLAERGAQVVLTDSHEARAEKVAAALADEIGAPVHHRRLDVGVRSDIESVTEWIADTLGPISILVNNAAYNVLGSIFDYDPDTWDRVLSVNLSGPWMLSRQAMRQMRDSGAGGVILNVSTYAPDIGGLGIEGPYAVSKGGLNVLTRSCAHEGGPYGIRVNTLSMGMVTGTRFTDSLHSDMREEETAKSPLGRLANVDDIVEAADFLISDRSAATTGEIINVAAGVHMRY